MSKAIPAVMFCVFMVYAFTASAQERARIGWAAMTVSHVPLWVAQEKGLLVKNGLAPELIFFGNGTTATQSLVAGDLDALLTSIPNVVNSRFGGGDTVMIMTIIPTFIDHIISASNITSPEQLKGKIGGVNRQGTVSEMGLRLALRRLGIDPEKDTKIISSGGNPERLAAISNGIVHFTIMNEPFIKEAERLGFRDLVNIATLKIPLHWDGVVTREATVKARRPMLTRLVRALTEAIHYIKVDKEAERLGFRDLVNIAALKIPLHWDGVVTREAIIKSRRPMLTRLVRALTEAIHYIKVDREATKAVIGKYTRLSDPDGLERTYKNYTAVLPETPYPGPAGVKTLLDDMAPRNPKAAAADPKIFVDQSFVQEMESSGFIKQLYKK